MKFLIQSLRWIRGKLSARRRQRWLKKRPWFHCHPSSHPPKSVQVSWTGRGAESTQPHITFGKNVWIGKDTEFSCYEGDRILINGETSINSNCKIYGTVRIGRYCSLAPNIFMSSGAHFPYEVPAMIIKRQDQQVMAPAGAYDRLSRPIVIEEDVWIGTGAFIQAGITIGRGAIVGANSTVLKDIAPYEVHAGSPARRVKNRLVFSPPKALHFMRSDDWPYFYRGFDHFEIGSNPKGARLIGDAELWLNAEHQTITIRGYCEGGCEVCFQVSDSSTRHRLSEAFEVKIEVPVPVGASIIKLSMRVACGDYESIGLFVTEVA